MPWSRPSFQDILNRVGVDIHTRMQKAGDALRRNCEDLLARALASQSHELHGAIARAARQSVPSLADDDEVILEWAKTMLEVPRKQPTRATGTVAFPGTDGVVIPLGREMSLLLKSETRFRTTAEVTVAGGSATVPVEAIDLGSIGNAALGAKTVLLVPIAGLVSTGTVLSPGITGGFDLETIASVKERVVHRFRNPPRGGVPADFEAWAREIPGVDKAWALPKWQGIGSIGVAIVTKHDTLEQWALPGAPLIAEVQAHIDSVAPWFMRSRPAIAPTLVVVDIEVLLSPDTPEVRAAVEAEIRDLFLREAEFGGQDEERTPTSIPLSHITEAISTAGGEVDHQLVAPVAALVADAGELVVPGTFTFGPL